MDLCKQKNRLNIFNFRSNQEEIFSKCVRDLIGTVINGYNGTIIAYGQSGTGKTYSMEGNFYIHICMHVF
jgi:Kinesin-like protein